MKVAVTLSPQSSGIVEVDPHDRQFRCLAGSAELDSLVHVVSRGIIEALRKGKKVRATIAKDKLARLV